MLQSELYFRLIPAQPQLLCIVNQQTRGGGGAGTIPPLFVVTVLIKHHVDIHIMTVNSIIFENDFKQ